MFDAFEASRSKLSDYAQTDDTRGHIYVISTMLAPVNQFEFFLSRDWDQIWQDFYGNTFQQALIP